MTPSSMMLHIGERISGQTRLTPGEIATFANMSGDHNPLHHDMVHARLTRFGGVIACGPQITSLMMGILATYFTRHTAALGLEFSFCLHQAVKAEETIEMEWEIVAIEPKTSLAGEIVTLQGKATNEHGKAVLTATSKVLVTSSL